MEEKEIIQQLKKMKTIRPSTQWAVLAKERILGREGKEQSIIGGTVIFWRRPVFVFSALAFVVVAALASFLFLDYKQGSEIVTQNIQSLMDRISSQSQDNKAVVESLSEVKSKLEEVSLTLDNLKNIKDKGQALAMAGVVKETTKRGAQAVEEMKSSNQNLSKQVLASLGEIQDVSQDLSQKSNLLEKEIFLNYLQELQRKTLSPEDEQRLKEVEEYYKQGQETEAVTLILRIGAK